MARRIHVTKLTAGENALDDAQAHHARNVLRLPDGTGVDIFDDHGATACGKLKFRSDGPTVVDVDEDAIRRGIPFGHLTIASAVPKGDRADWMVEKLSELGVAEWTPLAAERSVVLPEGTGKRDRWTRIATEAAKQSQRVGVMRIGPLTKLPALLASLADGAADGRSAWCLSTEATEPTFASDLASQAPPGVPLTLFVGPEGGWTPAELAAFGTADVTFVRLTPTVLRIETAAVAAAAVVASAWARRA